MPLCFIVYVRKAFWSNCLLELRSTLSHSLIPPFVRLCLLAGSTEHWDFKWIEMWRHYASLVILPITVLYGIRNAHTVHMKFFLAHCQQPFRVTRLNMFIPIQVATHECTTVEPNHNLLAKLFPSKHSISSTLCSIVDFVTLTLILPHGCSSIPSTSTFSTLPLYTSDQVEFGKWGARWSMEQFQCGADRYDTACFWKARIEGIRDSARH